ncbi:formylmethanofuran dehydrogenase subunit C [Candidatus Bathyarchaeota archaeon]|nr:MAG: formylmethanofuran dehydrogenase subunit C [Candidatus Bathyarchaeota archaeon]
MINLYAKREFKYPIFAECITPDNFEGKSAEEIGELKVWEGNKEKKLAELFKVEKIKKEDEKEPVIAIYGDLSKIRMVGAKMTKGQIIIHGDVGMYLGQEMRGGKIAVRGDAAGWAGSMMKGGVIEIFGNAGSYLAAPYRGSMEGMRGGKIIVHGNAGNEAGAYMRKGTIKIYGNAGQFAGLRMRKGTIYIKGNCEERAGACMTGGKIVVGGVIESVLPTFTIEGLKKKVKIEEGEVVEGPFYLFSGDITENGDGKLYISKNRNPHLNFYEKFL